MRERGYPKTFWAMATPLLPIQLKPKSVPPACWGGGLSVLTKNMLITFDGKPNG